MKKILIPIITFISSLLLTCFIQGNINVFQWDNDIRLLIIVVSFLAYFMILEENKANKENKKSVIKKIWQN